MLISLALGTGLRLAELLGLNVVDLRPDGRRIRRRLRVQTNSASQLLPLWLTLNKEQPQFSHNLGKKKKEPLTAPFLIP